VFGGGLRCYADRDRFYSYRRDGKTGRMATLVWMK
jgi:copper oxidase (laccase) domain-containing protein